jgi:hypothetical protein
MRRISPAVNRGLIAGLLGAAALAAWFLVIDLIRAQPFHTPAFVASSLSGLGHVQASPGLLAMYTALHFAAFILIGVLVSWTFDRMQQQAHPLLGLVLGFLLFDLVFYLGVVITGVDVVRELGWPEVLAGNLFAGLVLMTYLSWAGPGVNVSWRTLWREHRVVREAIVAGLLGAVSVATWFLVIDAVRGKLFFTPAALGSAIFFGARGIAEVQMSIITIAGYTFLHFAAFLLVGVIAAALADAAEKNPPLLLGLALLFVTFEVLFIGIMAIAATWLLDALAWWTVAIANLIAASAMGAYLWHVHPFLREELTRDLEEELVRQES